jgi:hypothetical protein
MCKVVNLKDADRVPRLVAVEEHELRARTYLCDDELTAISITSRVNHMKKGCRQKNMYETPRYVELVEIKCKCLSPVRINIKS